MTADANADGVGSVSIANDLVLICMVKQLKSVGRAFEWAKAPFGNPPPIGLQESPTGGSPTEKALSELRGDDALCDLVAA